MKTNLDTLTENVLIYLASLTLYIIVPAVVDYNTITVIMESGNFL